MIEEIISRKFVKSLISDILMCKTPNKTDIDFKYPIENNNYYNLETIIDELTKYISENYKSLLKLYEELDETENSEIKDEVDCNIEDWFKFIVKYLPIIDSMQLDCRNSFFDKIREFCEKLD